MNIGLFDLFKISIGPSSSHTFAPMLASGKFIKEVVYQDLLHATEEITIEFFGSLALSGRSQRADVTSVLGLMGISPENINLYQIKEITSEIKKNNALKLNNQRHIRFNWEKHIIFHSNHSFKEYSNALCIKIKGNNGKILKNSVYYSTGSGNFIEKGEQEENQIPSLIYPFSSMAELRNLCEKNKKNIAEIVCHNELIRLNLKHNQSNLDDLYKKIDQLWAIIKSSIEKGVHYHGTLPGGLNVNRRAPYLHEMIKLKTTQDQTIENNDWVNLCAMAVSEENAAGGKIVCVPSNGSAGVIAAVLAYYNKFISTDNTQGIRTFIATSAAIGALYKNHQSIRSLQLGCQGEIGVACSMAAAGLTAANGGNTEQIENAAKLGMEHNIGLTCNPIGGLVQIPCIERNCMGAIKAINASRLALTTEYHDSTSLDNMIKNMHQAGLNMSEQYKETSLGGASKNLISVNIVYC